MSSLSAYFPLCVGAVAGASSRYFIGEMFAKAGFSSDFAIFSINVVGCFFAGCLLAFFAENITDTESAKLFYMTGFLGSFTTFSAYSLEIIVMMQNGRSEKALLYAFGTVIACVFFAGVGMFLIRKF